MKSKYFIISENADGTFDIRSKNGRNIEAAAHTYEINPKQPKYIKVAHDGGRWCSLYHYRGYAAKEAMWVHDVVLLDDGSYNVKEYIHETEWKHYENPEKKVSSNTRVALLFCAIVAGIYVGVGLNSRSCVTPVEKVPAVPRTAPVQIPVDTTVRQTCRTQEHVHE